MRTTRYEERCPHCRKLLYYDSIERGISMGNTINTCVYCNENYLDEKVFEWVNLNYEQKKAVLTQGTDMTIVTEEETRKALKNYGFSKYLLIGIPLVKKLEKQMENFENFVYKPEMLLQPDIQESIKRTSNQDYLALLLRMGRNYYGEDFK